MLTYQKRNLENINKLADHTKIAALKWHDFLVENNIDILIYSTIRTIDEQRANVKNGVSQTMKSYHLVGQALDWVLIVNGKDDWNGYSKPESKKAIAESKRLGFEWGGDWKSFKDQPHLQYNWKGYGTDTFGVYKEEVKQVEQTKSEPKKETPKPVEKPSPKPTFQLTYTRILKEGMEGNDVNNLQKALNQLNFKCGKEDGDYGKLVKDAVTRFQKVYLPYDVDGKVGKQTISKINSLLK